MRPRLDEIESRLQKFIESSLSLLPGGQPSRLIHSLVQALEQTVAQQADGNLVASNVFTIQVHPQDAPIWEDHPRLLAALARVLEDSARDSGLHFSNPVSLTIEIIPDQSPGTFTITSTTYRPNIDATSALPVVEPSSNSGLDPRPTSSFLIFANNQTFPMRLPVINMGRRADNQLVIEDPRVSRVHAQLRAVHGAYILFDLNSTGGTFVNNLRISQKVLKPGDVISLAGYPLIYGEDRQTASAPVDDTMPQSPS